jgi:hypothetical protein
MRYSERRTCALGVLVSTYPVSCVVSLVLESSTQLSSPTSGVGCQTVVKIGCRYTQPEVPACMLCQMVIASRIGAREANTVEHVILIPFFNPDTYSRLV